MFQDDLPEATMRVERNSNFPASFQNAEPGPAISFQTTFGLGGKLTFRYLLPTVPLTWILVPTLIGRTGLR